MEWIDGYAMRAGGPARRASGSPDASPCAHAPQKSTAITDMPAVPKPTQVGGYTDTQARERNLVKELGNMAP